MYQAIQLAQEDHCFELSIVCYQRLAAWSQISNVITNDTGLVDIKAA
jgi:hypothetical protein